VVARKAILKITCANSILDTGTAVKYLLSGTHADLGVPVIWASHQPRKNQRITIATKNNNFSERLESRRYITMTD
jgi:hypothetical protein